MSNINKIRLSGQTYNIQDLNATKTVELTQAEYDALSQKDQNTFYIITDAEAGDLSNYYTKTETDNAITAATSTKQDTLISGTNIKTINGDTLLGEGNITIEGGGGGGKAIEAGTNISITTGETADTINCTLPITATTDTTNKTISIGQNVTSDTNRFGCVVIGSDAKGKTYDVVVGNKAKNNGDWNDNVIIGYGAKGYSQSIAIGSYTETYNDYQAGCVAIGYNAKAKNIKNAVAIGEKVSTTGTTKTNINNQLTIDTSNQIYIYNKDNTEMICLQDQLGGGTVDTEITSASTNPVTSAAIYNQFGGLKLVKLTQSEYDSLTTKDSNTLFVIVN